MTDTPSHDSSDAGKVRFPQRISFRLAIFLAVMMVVFSYVGPALEDVVLEHLGGPGPDEYVFLTPDEEEREEMRREEEAYAAHLADVVLAHGKRDDSGRWLPSAETVRLVSEVLGAQETAFVWLDAEQRVVAATPFLPWSAGQEWPFGTKSHSDIEVPGDDKCTGHVVYVPVARDDGVAGTFALLMFDGAVPGAAGVAESDSAVQVDEHGADSADELLVMSEPEFDALVERTKRIASTVTIAIALAIALFLGVVLSLLVTRRMRRLAAVARAPGGDHAGLPGPFDERGNDEIALLARSMNAMRSRAAELVNDLEKQDAARCEWIAQVSHDLRTPLTALLACLDRTELVLESADGESLKREMHRFLAVARADADRVQTLADDLFEIARLEASDPLDLEEVPPGELARQAIMELEPMAAQLGITLEASLTRSLPILIADGRRLMRALQNLLRNAIQHAAQRVEVRACAHGDGVRFEVRDDGNGFPEQDGDVVLCDLGRDRGRGDSAGLGLTVTRRVAEAHGGRIGACNLDTGGASVWIVIPVATDHFDADAP
ncbi:MAG: HAMP domain-containing histidine kinase [Phycisphaerae bacterium]|nr:HAMP domain-containing histidine kinase [Phycisphaerae bacterium]